jgi:aldehyde dehydrogenase (NAD+)
MMASATGADRRRGGRGSSVGPLISARQKNIVQGFLAGADEDGLAPVAEGQMPKRPDGRHYVRPTLYGDVDPGPCTRPRRDLRPGPGDHPVRDEDEAVAIANGTDYGLVAGIWTNDGGRQMRMAREIRSGQVFINNYGAGGGVELPFGGVGKSGHGREKGFEALYGFSALKTVAVWHGR